jgi:hypothetical protein
MTGYAHWHRLWYLGIAHGGKHRTKIAGKGSLWYLYHSEELEALAKALGD